jgi:hypothetical protein
MANKLLFITPKVSWSGKFGEGFAITEPTTGYSICYGKTKLDALILLRRKANEKREEWEVLEPLFLSRRGTNAFCKFLRSEQHDHRRIRRRAASGARPESR